MEAFAGRRLTRSSLAVKHSEHHNRFHLPNALQTRRAESFFDRRGESWLLTGMFAPFARNEGEMTACRKVNPEV